jgi:hypothetical protein
MTYAIVNGVLKRNGQPFTPDDCYRGLGLKGWDGSEIVYWRVPSLGLIRRITRNGETWWEPLNDRKFVGPVEVRKMIAEQEKERGKLEEGA